MEKSNGLVHCSVICVKTIMKESPKFELAHLKKKKKKKRRRRREEEEEKEEELEKKKNIIFRRLVTFWFGTFAMLFSTTGCVVRHENTRKWMVGCYNGL